MTSLRPGHLTPIQDDGTLTDQGVHLLDEWLSADDNKGLPYDEVQKLAKQNGISRSTLGRAAKRLHVKRARVGFGKNQRAFWRLPIRAKPTVLPFPRKLTKPYDSHNDDPTS